MKNNYIEQKKIVKDILNKFYNGVNCLDLVKYIRDNNLINKINLVIDNIDTSNAFDSTSLTILRHIIRLYIKRFCYVEHSILTFLEEQKEYDFEILRKKFELSEMPSIEIFSTIVTRFEKLGFIKKSNETIIKYTNYLNNNYKRMLSNEGKKEENAVNSGLKAKLKRYIDEIVKLKKLYDNGIPLSEINNLVKYNAETFYHNIHSYSNIFDSFAIKLADYRYDEFLKNKYISILNIDNNKSKEEICNAIYENSGKLSAINIQKRINNYIKLSPLVTDKQKKYLIWLGTIYEDFYKKKKNEIKNVMMQAKYNELLKLYEELINAFINSGEKDVDLYCKQNNIYKNLFNKAVFELNKSNSNMYYKYVAYTKEYINQKKKEYISFVNTVVKYCREGITDNGIKRNFDIIDYFKITSIPPKKIFEFIKWDLEIEDYSCFSDFIKKNTIGDELLNYDMENVLSTPHIINVSFNILGNVDENSGIEITLEQKKKH